MRNISVRGVIVNQDKIFLVRMHENSYFCLPGGRVEEGEDLLTALNREIVEELGQKPKIGNLLVVHQYKQDDRYTPPDFWFHITNGEDFLDINIKATTHGEAELAQWGFTNIDDVSVLPVELKGLMKEFKESNFKGNTKLLIIDQ